MRPWTRGAGSLLTSAAMVWTLEATVHPVLWVCCVVCAVNGIAWGLV